MDLCTGMDADFITQGRVMDHPGRNPWAVLGLAEGASQTQIRRAFRDQAKRTHPDAGGRAERFVAVKAAYDQLCATLPPAGPVVPPSRPTPYDTWLAPILPVRVWAEQAPPVRPGPSPRGLFCDLLATELAKAGSSVAA